MASVLMALIDYELSRVDKCLLEDDLEMAGLFMVDIHKQIDKVIKEVKGEVQLHTVDNVAMRCVYWENDSKVVCIVEFMHSVGDSCIELMFKDKSTRTIGSDDLISVKIVTL